MRHSNKKNVDKHEHTPELDALITRLESASKRLNSAARRATRRIEALDERLVATDPGIEIWGPMLLTEATSFQREGADTPQAAERVVRLGYAKVKKDRWGLAVHEVVKAGGSVLSDTTRLLHKAERHLRLLALPHLTALTRQIVEALEAQTAGLEDSADEDDDDDESAEHDAAHADN
jgi:exonuclease VII small subunit